MNITIYTDGACKGNPGRGGWAAYSTDSSIDLNGHAPSTTNNEMELRAVIESLKPIPEGSRVLFRTDSKLVIGWLSQGWKCSTNPKIPPMIRDYFRYRSEKSLEVAFEHVQGHGSDPYNGYVDGMASARCKG